MQWQPPDLNDIEALRWVGLAGIMAAIIDLLKAAITRSETYSWWQRVAHAALIGLLSVGLGAMLIDVFPTISFFMLLGISSMAGYLGSDWVMDLALKVFNRGSKT